MFCDYHCYYNYDNNYNVRYKFIYTLSIVDTIERKIDQLNINDTPASREEM